jgi:hypothetical protein
MTSALIVSTAAPLAKAGTLSTATLPRSAGTPFNLLWPAPGSGRRGRRLDDHALTPEGATETNIARQVALRAGMPICADDHQPVLLVWSADDRCNMNHHRGERLRRR